MAQRSSYEALKAQAHHLALLANKKPLNPPTTEASAYARFTCAAVHELLLGVIAEAKAGRYANVARLVRHIWEHELEATYILGEDTRFRIGQMHNAYARVAILNRGPESPDAMIAEYQRAVEAAKAEERAQKERGGVPLEKRPFPPKWEDMARLCGRSDEYERIYRRLSSHAHPGIWGSSRYSVVDPEVLRQVGEEFDEGRVPEVDGGSIAIVAGVKAHDLAQELAEVGGCLVQRLIELCRPHTVPADPPRPVFPELSQVVIPA